MTQGNATALELFRKFAPRFREISFKPAGFLEQNSDRFFLRPARGETVLDYQALRSGYPCIDMKKARCNFRADFKARKGIAPLVQHNDAAWSKIRRELFPKRRFYMDPDTGPVWRSARLLEKDYMPAIFTVRPWPVRGMRLTPMDQSDQIRLHWSAFVPAGTRECLTIAAAIHFENLKEQLAKSKSNKTYPPSDESMRQAEVELAGLLEKVPA